MPLGSAQGKLRFVDGVLAALIIGMGSGLLVAWRQGGTAGAAGRTAPTRVVSGLDRPAVAGGPVRADPRRAPPELLTASAGSRALELVPGRPGYDPTRFRDLLTTPDLHAQEPRNEAWAAPVEAALGELIAADVRRAMPGIELGEVECKTTMCSISWRGDEDQRHLLERTVHMLIPGARSAVVRGPTDHYYLALLGGEFYGDLPINDPQAAIARLHKMRARFIKGAKQQRSPMDPGVPVPPALWSP